MLWIYLFLLLIGVGIVFVVVYVCLTNKYFECVDGKCVKGGRSYKNDPTCNNECATQPPSNKNTISEECVYTEPTCNQKCGTQPEYYKGDGQATTTYFTEGESKGAGACGGCIYPGVKNIPVNFDFTNNNFNNLYDQMKNIVTDGAHWTMSAASEAMMAPYCSNSVGMGCTGRNNPTGKTASAPCGSCWRLTRKDNKKVLNVVVADGCPCGNTSVCPTTAGGADNSKWCMAEPGEPNHLGYYNHFDVWNATDSVLNWPSAGTDGDPVTFENIECPPQINKLMADSCCGTYYDGSEGGSPQGCPNICGSEYVCP
jgi:hypothetical protein